MTTIDEFFDDQGPLAAVHPGYRERSEQLRLATSVGATLAGGGALLADGPTGIGKSMAYLVPAALFPLFPIAFRAAFALSRSYEAGSFLCTD